MSYKAAETLQMNRTLFKGEMNFNTTSLSWFTLTTQRCFLLQQAAKKLNKMEHLAAKETENPPLLEETKHRAKRVSIGLSFSMWPET